MGNPRDIRRAAGISQLRVAASTGASLPTVSKYEANPDAVSDVKRRALDPYYQQMAAGLENSP